MKWYGKLLRFSPIFLLTLLLIASLLSGKKAADEREGGRDRQAVNTRSQAAGSEEFDIPYNRQQLADYLGVDRSALSAVISSLSKEGVFEVKRSHFKLL